jgi:hypothetical protein
MSDDLNGRFAAFEADSLARTKPPGTAAVRRTVRRRHATRAVALGATAAVLAVVALLTNGTSRPPLPRPVTTMSPSAMPAPSTSPTIRAPRATAPPTTPPTPSINRRCNPDSNSFVGGELTGGPDAYTLTDGMLTTCPDLQLSITRVTYVTKGAAKPSTLSQTGLVTRTLAADNRTVTMPAASLPAGSCYTYLVLTLLWRDGAAEPPSSVPNQVPTLVANGSDDEIQRYWGPLGASVLLTAWGTPTCG